MKAGDKFGPARLRQAVLKHFERLEAEAEALDPKVNIDAVKPAQEIKEIIPELRGLLDEAGKFLKDKK